ncbi:MAG: hypothetical protein IPK85_08975 [Gemmatimonadetes bacterium]|nr:hypothetical protein [Gemmatimonadota bacterium]
MPPERIRNTDHDSLVLLRRYEKLTIVPADRYRREEEAAHAERVIWLHRDYTKLLIRRNGISEEKLYMQVATADHPVEDETPRGPQR